MTLPILLVLAQAVSPYPAPQSAYLNDAMKATQSIADSTAAAGGMLTVAEKSNYRETGDYAEAVAFYRGLEKASKLAKLVPIGRSAAGHEMYVFIVSKNRAFTPESARKTGKPVILLQNGIHAGENGGKDAAMMLLRDVLVTKKFAAWLDDVIILSIPVFNIDGHERPSPYSRINENGPDRMGFRANSQRLNLNRDYMKSDTPEMRAWLALYTAWLPDFLIDNHVTDGSDHQYDVTIETHTEQDIAAPVGGWVKHHYLPSMMSAMERDGHVVGWYSGGPPPQRGASLPVFTSSPRYSTGYAATQNRAALLVETHSLKPFKVRTWSHYDIMRATIDAMAAKAKELRASSLEADRLAEAIRPGDKVFLEGVPGGAAEPYTMRQLEAERYTGVAAGGPVIRYTARPLNIDLQLIRGLTPKVEPSAPLGYIVPRQWGEVIDLLRRHGIRMEPAATGTAEAETVRFSNVKFSPAPFEGRFQVTAFDTAPVQTTAAVPAGSVFVPSAQRANRILMHILEPDAPDSALRWGFFQSIFEQKEYFAEYVFEPIAAEMLRRDPKLKAAFEAELEKNPAMKSNTRARLTWLYERSPYLEPDKNLYPVLRVQRR